LNQCEVLGPTSPLVSKVNNYYLRDVLIKTNQRTTDLVAFKKAIWQCVDAMKSEVELKSVRVLIDVDPS